ncbi:MAG: CHRD domain-containing protein [Candidatus Eiseniibacteriota bacterium]
MRRTLPLPVVLACALLIAVPAAAQNYNAIIDGTQEVPPRPSLGTGLGCFVLNPDNTLSYNVTFGGLLAPETAAHIHGPAAPGVNAGIIFPFALGSPKVGVFGPLNATQLGYLTGGLLYVNIHTSLYPGGEIRGQILAGGCTVSVEGTPWGRVKAQYAD